MKTRPAPPAQNLTDAALFALADTPAKEQRRQGLSNASGPASGPLMSLEESRLCNDRWCGEVGSEPLVASIEWSRVTIYRQPSARPPKPSDRPPGNGNLTRGRFNGYMSPASRRTFKRIVGTWLRSMQLYRAEVKRKYDPGRAYPTFCTLTLSAEQTHTDREIYRACLMPWLQIMRREYGVEHYAWRAEAQENGNLHYHVLLDRYIPKESVTGSWNMCQDALGYRSKFARLTGSICPPSTQIMEVKTHRKDKKTGKVREVDPVAYMLDYLTDTPQEVPTAPGEERDPNAPRKLQGRYRLPNGDEVTYTTRPISGRVWGMSDGLRNLSEPKSVATAELVGVLQAAATAGTLRQVATEHAVFFFGPVALVLGRSSPAAWHTVKAYYLQVFGALYPAQLPREHLAKHPPMDPIGLWIDPHEAALYYPPSHAERVDAWTKANAPDPRLQLRFLKGGATLVPTPEYAYRRARFARKRARLGLPAYTHVTSTLTNTF